MNTTPIQLNIYDLYRSINEKKEKKNVSYNEILYKIHAKIKQTTEVEKYKLIYEIPEVVFGLPSYDLNLCMAYIIKQLRNNGFLVKYYFPKILYISWDPREIKEYKRIKNNQKKLLRQQRIQSNEIQNPENYYSLKKNIDYKEQLPLEPPINTKHESAIFKPILKYEPNTIPSYNYYAYSTLNQNLVNENFYIENKGLENNNKISEPDHFKQIKIDALNKQEEDNKKNQLYQRDIMDYYKEEDDHPFKNSIKKYNSKGKFILDLT